MFLMGACSAPDDIGYSKLNPAIHHGVSESSEFHPTHLIYMTRPAIYTFKLAYVSV